MVRLAMFHRATLVVVVAVVAVVAVAVAVAGVDVVGAGWVDPGRTFDHHL